MAQRIEIFSAGCPVCVSGEALVREVAGDSQEVVVHDLRNDEAAALAAEQGIKAVPAVVVDGRLLGCCSNAGPDRDELVAAGVGQPRG
jgi:glutaredoxin